MKYYIWWIIDYLGGPRQLLILLCTGSSIWFFASKKGQWRGFITGLIGQPLWLIETFEKKQWGIFIVCAWYTFNHIRGLYNEYYRRKINR
jgi:hypothetical protein